MSVLRYGLFCKEGNFLVPLKSLNVNAQISDTIVRVSYSQTFYNEHEKFLETEFFFPISLNSAFDSFKAAYGGTEINGCIAEKGEAKKAFEEAKQGDRTAALSEIIEELGDIMKVAITNIPPKSEIIISFSYIEQLSLYLNSSWCFKVYSTITPRYYAGGTDKFEQTNLLSNYPSISLLDKEAYGWSIKVEIQSSTPIQYISSSSHLISIQYFDEKHRSEVILNPCKPNTDFILLYNNGQENKLIYHLAPYDEGYCAMLSFYPEYEKINQQQVLEYAKTGDTTVFSMDIDQINGEYIFFLDRSGSMSGARIEQARKALILFLMSLPSNSLFNVVSFGSKSERMFSDSAPYDQGFIQEAIAKIKKFDADMGGTELFEPLVKEYSYPLQQGFPRSFFLLTDGAI